MAFRFVAVLLLDLFELLDFRALEAADRARSARARARLAWASARRDSAAACASCRSARNLSDLALAFRAATRAAFALAAARAAARCAAARPIRRGAFGGGPPGGGAFGGSTPLSRGLGGSGGRGAALSRSLRGGGSPGGGGFRRSDPSSDALLDRGPLGLQLGVSTLVGHHVVSGGRGDGALLTEQPRHVGRLRRGPPLERLGGPQIGGGPLPVRRHLAFHDGGAGSSRVQLALDLGQPFDLARRGVEQCRGPLQTGRQVGRRGTLHQQRDRQEVRLLLILVADDVAGPGVLGVEALLTHDHGGFRPRQGGLGPGQLARHQPVTLSSHLKLPAGCRPAQRGRSAGPIRCDQLPGPPAAATPTTRSGCCAFAPAALEAPCADR